MIQMMKWNEMDEEKEAERLIYFKQKKKDEKMNLIV